METTTIRTLLVEDEPDLREIVKVSLGLDPGFVVTTYPSGIEALAALRGGTARFDVALLDIRLPMMSGVEFFDHLRRLPGMKELKVIFMTASLTSTDLERVKKRDTLGIIHKPFHPLSLASDIRAMMERADAGGK